MPNRLAHETSPYLQQHAGNPVNWYPWGDEALALARDTARPILLSVGYSACHWCHVMAHECFEDADTAALMNRHFVNIKVDREERPDIDQIYQTAHQLMTRAAGGWPLTMFLTPQGKPFYGGTYFPKRSRYNRPSFDDLLQRVAEVWDTQREQVNAQGDEIVRALASTLPPRQGGGGAGPPQHIAAQAAAGLRDALMQSFDPVNGGFGGAPKFPHPANLAALLRHAVAEHDDSARDAVLLSLRRMAEGGLADQLGGGFCRYSTDARWQIPHFEKMLYDNGPLLHQYAEAWQLTGEALFRQVCEDTAAWLMREMQAGDGGYFSSIDADSQGEEGQFYVWQREQVAQQLGEAEFAAFAARFGLDAPPNFEGRAWHLHVALPLADVAAQLGRTPAECATLVADARARLFALRETRERPGRDDKVLTSWNALAITGMAFAARVFGEPRWAASARRAADFVRGALWHDGRLLATHKDGRSQLNAYLDDHAFMLGALFELMQGDVLRAADLQWACALADRLLDQFEDGLDGGFFFTSHDHEALVLRPKSAHDGATPSGNGMAALQLQRLGHLVGEPRYLRAAQRTLDLFAAEVQRAPQAYATLVTAMAEAASPPTLAILTGPAPALAAWRVELARLYLPGVLVLQLPDDTSGLPELLAKPASADPLVWVCRGARCLPPITDMQALVAVLNEHDAER
ncbi:thioredoxin domain-containing protein [Piscinibacter sp.]|uniref:thioredoxin domain-containing protein n=1 Tax=Piscinibacter sp. TaxID=1903157 RepID=UPI00355A3836